MSVNEDEHSCITQHLYGSTHKFIVFASTSTTVQNCRMLCNSIFTSVLRAWTTALFSTLQWGSLKLTTIIILESFCILIYLSTTSVCSQVVKNGIHLSMHFKPLNGYIFCSYPLIFQNPCIIIGISISC